MKKWTLIEQTSTPDGQVVSLYEHDGVWSIRVGSAELMSTRNHSSEEQIARLACAGLQTARKARVLVGGLGMGFTLKTALACLGPGAVIVAAEILAAVIEWNRNPALPLAGSALTDPRVTVVHQDVIEVIHAARGVFDSIILDVDNGPVAMTTSGNARLYDDRGLQSIRRALKPGGCAAFWSAAPNTAFHKAFRRAGFTVQTHRCRSHTVFVGHARGPGA